MDDLQNIADNIKLHHCTRCDGLFFVNVITGEKISATCKSYSCEYCGPKKAWKLENALTSYFSTFDRVRLWTFNCRTSLIDNHKNGLFSMSEVWRRFIIYMRRCSALSNLERQFKYVKVLEFTLRGYPHFHVMVDKYLPWIVVSGCWHSAINSVYHSKGDHGKATVKASFSSKNAARYCAKYVLKSAKERKHNFHLWSKSGQTSIFESRISNGEWQFLNQRHENLYLSEFSISSQGVIFSDVKDFVSGVILEDIDLDYTEIDNFWEMVRNKGSGVQLNH